jgi:hypothetical protein
VVQAARWAWLTCATLQREEIVAEPTVPGCARYVQKFALRSCLLLDRSSLALVRVLLQSVCELMLVKVSVMEQGATILQALDRLHAEKLDQRRGPSHQSEQLISVPHSCCCHDNGAEKLAARTGEGDSGRLRVMRILEASDC